MFVIVAVITGSVVHYEQVPSTKKCFLGTKILLHQNQYSFIFTAAAFIRNFDVTSFLKLIQTFFYSPIGVLKQENAHQSKHSIA